MSARTHLSATRVGLLRAQQRLQRLERGTSLLRRKREALVGELFRIARSAADSRVEIDAQARKAWPALLRALSAEGRVGLQALGWPARGVRVEVRTDQVWGVTVSDVAEAPRFARTLAARGIAPGASPAAVEAASAFEKLADLLVGAAPREMLLRRLGEALAQTSRQVNSLEHHLTPDLQRQLLVVRRTLDEREREEHVRLGLLARRGRAH
ncbi:MAG: V-type ATP synthase subunit D [Myxococcaceae bacterium]